MSVHINWFTIYKFWLARLLKVKFFWKCLFKSTRSFQSFLIKYYFILYCMCTLLVSLMIYWEMSLPLITVLKCMIKKKINSRLFSLNVPDCAQWPMPVTPALWDRGRKVRPSGLGSETLSQVKEQKCCLFFLTLSTWDSQSSDISTHSASGRNPAPSSFQFWFSQGELELWTGGLWGYDHVFFSSRV